MSLSHMAVSGNGTQSGSDGHKGVLRIPQSSSITESSASDCLVSYKGHSLGKGSYHIAENQSVYSTAPTDWVMEKLEVTHKQQNIQINRSSSHS